MTPKKLIAVWVKMFNDADALANFYDENAVNHQVPQKLVKGRDAIRNMFVTEFSRANMTCIVENIFEDGEWGILEWRDPLGLRGCGFFHIVNDRIVLQRGYWDKLTFIRLHGLPIPPIAE
jgi:hypothetical protein